MNTNSNTTAPEITLSPAEREMVELNRKQAQLEAEQKAAKAKLEREKLVAQFKQTNEKILSEKAFDLTTTKSYYNQLQVKFPGKYGLEIINQTLAREEYTYISDEEAKQLGVSDKKLILATETLEYEVGIISRADAKSIKIVVKERITGYGYSRKSQGYRMYIEGIGYEHQNKGLKNVETLDRNIESFLNSRKREKESADQKTLGKKILMETLTNEFPEATFEESSETWGYGNYRIPVVKVTFKNGLRVTYMFDFRHSEGQQKEFVKSIFSIETEKLNQDEVVNLLKELPTKKETK